MRIDQAQRNLDARRILRAQTAPRLGADSRDHTSSENQD